MKSKKLNKTLRVLIIVCTAILILFTYMNISKAAIATSGGAGEIPTMENPIGDSNEITGIKGLGGIIIGMIQWIGSAIAVIVVVVNGIKYMFSSVEEKAEYKKTCMYYVIGSILVFSAVNILSWIYSLF